MYIDIFLQCPVRDFVSAAITSLSHIVFCFREKISEYVFMLMDFTFEIPRRDTWLILENRGLS